MQLSNAKEIVLHQDAEWSRVMSEETERQSLIRYGITLMVIAYALMFILTALAAMAVSTIVPFSAAHVVTSVVIQFALTVATIYFVPQILAALAPSFGGENNSLNALKLFVFAATPAWLGTAIAVVPIIGWLAAIAGAVYAIYLFWQHVADALSIPAEKKVGYVVVSVVVLAVVQLVIGAIGAGIANAVSPYPIYHIGRF